MFSIPSFSREEPRGRPSSGSIAALIGVQVLFGLHYLAAKLVVEQIPPRPWAFLRAGSAALLLLGLTMRRRIPLPHEPGSMARFLGLSLLGVAINQYLFVEGISRTTPGHSSLINTSIPVLVLLMAVLLGRERPTTARIAGIATTLFGVLVLMGRSRIEWPSGSLWGDLLTLGNAVSYSIFLVLGKPVFERHGTLAGTALLLSLGALWLLPIGGPDLAALDLAAIDGRTWALAVFIILGPTVGAYVLNTYALRRVDSSLVAFFIYLQPVIGAGLSIAFGLERPTPRLFAAAAVVFAGVFLALRARNAGPPQPPTPLEGDGLALRASPLAAASVQRKTNLG